MKKMQEYKKFQFLIGIINQILTELLETEIPVFQFLIGIINPSDGLALLRLCLVSIPHRYYKSVGNIELLGGVTSFNSS